MSVDFEKKVLIHIKKNLISPVGGPRGYIYNLKTFFEQNNINNVHYCDEEKDNQDSVIAVYKKQKGVIKDKILTPLRNFICYGMPLVISRRDKDIDDGKYDIIHFHTTLEMYKCRQSLKHYKGVVVLTSHTPMVTHKEILMMLTEAEKKWLGFVYNKMPLIDEYAFNRANYIIFPCEDAEEPYYNTWEAYKVIKDRNRKKYRYLLTGIEKCSSNIKRVDLRRKYQIPEDAFVFCYVGRHNSTKGYDRLKTVASKILQKNSNVYFLIAGKEEPLIGLQDKRWIEVGWTNDPHSVIAASDFFVLPNLETYFDLILLEVISLGIPVLASKTGGNRYFDGSPGITLFENDGDFLKKMENILTLSQDELTNMGISNQKLFENKFTKEKFGQAYINLINSFSN